MAKAGPGEAQWPIFEEQRRSDAFVSRNPLKQFAGVGKISGSLDSQPLQAPKLEPEVAPPSWTIDLTQIHQSAASTGEPPT